ncbi:MAG: NfeD family protein [candidate division KSB1 bacterium]|nr:NfeD family protein [candidate division KSB1 bacterium]
MNRNLKFKLKLEWLLVIAALLAVFLFDDILYFLLFEKLFRVELHAVLRYLIFTVILLLNVLLAAAVYRVLRKRPTTGREGMLGLRAVTLTPVDRERGWIRVHGERWQAVSDRPIPQGERVVIVEMDGLVARVQPLKVEGTGMAKEKRLDEE